MCNYEEYVKNKGRAEGRLLGEINMILNRMKKRNLSAIEAMKDLDIEEKDFPIYLPYLQV